MQTEIISIGSELTSGQNLDTNSQWLSQRLAEIGIPVHWHTTIADDLEDNVAAFRIAAGRARLVLVTGGAGPPPAPLAPGPPAPPGRGGLAAFAPPDRSPKLREIPPRRGRAMPEVNRIQAMFPAGAEPIPNRHGTAPGIRMHIGPCLIVAMPGVPSEMRAMYEGQV